ncbi:hypothetical protein C8R46DRAFT_1036094 [Mycena filopes]|nr:hypothetical protein C8R46DRAFT_1036094 [Mycena filopes]
MDTKSSSDPAIPCKALEEQLSPPSTVQTGDMYSRRDLAALDANADVADLGPFRRLFLGATMLLLGLVNVAVLTMCAHAILAVAFPDRYLPALPWAPAVGVLGLVHFVYFLSLIILAVSFVIRPTAPEESLYCVIPSFIFRTATPWWSMCLHYPFATLLGVYSLSSPFLFGVDTGLHWAEALNIGIAAGVLHFVLHFVQLGTVTQVGGGVELVGLAGPFKDVVIALCGHAALLIAAPHLAHVDYAHLAHIDSDYAATLPTALRESAVALTWAPTAAAEMQAANTGKICAVSETCSDLADCVCNKAPTF